jgi:hypothetical protein
MSSHHDHDNHSSEPKKVSFRTPMILAFVTVLIILLGVSTCDKKHECCEDGEKCEAAHESKHGEHGVSESHGTESHKPAHESEAHQTLAVDTTAVIAPDTTAKHEAPAHH